MEGDKSPESKERIGSYLKKSADEGYACGAQNSADQAWQWAQMEESEERFQVAVEYVQKAIEKTDTMMIWQFVLGQAYQTGKGVEQNDKKVYYDFDRAATDVHNARQIKIEFLWTGRGVQKNIKEAERLMREWQTNRSNEGMVIDTFRSRLIREDQNQRRGSINEI
jgi:TPR repeat protein